MSAADGAAAQGSPWQHEPGGAGSAAGALGLHGELRPVQARAASRTWQAGGQPAFGRYLSDPHASLGHAHGLIVLTLAGDRICGITGFNNNSVLPRFGLPRNLPD